MTSKYFGWKIRVGQWQSEKLGKKEEAVVILTGRGDFLEKYSHLATALNARGYEVFSLDWPGQGASQRLGRHPQMGHIASYDNYITVFREFLELHNLCQKPMTWVAYSMGATISLKILVTQSYQVQKIILLSPMFGFADDLPEALTRPLAIIANALGLSKHFAFGEQPTDIRSWHPSKSQVISGIKAFDDFKTFLQRRPDYIYGGSSWGWVKASLEAFSQLEQTDLSHLNLPILLVSSEKELTVSKKRQLEFVKRIPNAVLLKVKGKHDVLLGEAEETGRLFQHIFEFMDAP